MAQYMYSIPHKPPHSKREWFSSVGGVPQKKYISINRLQMGWKRYHPTFLNKEGVGVSFFGRKRGVLSMETHPLVFSNSKGWGVYI